VFYYDKDQGVLTGIDAENAGQGEDAKNLKRGIKMELTDTSAIFRADGKTFKARDVAACILGGLVKEAKDEMTRLAITEDLEGCVVSVPAAFSLSEKTFIKEALETPPKKGGPGLKVWGFIKEPVAAAISYFNDSYEKDATVLVFDLGGGTCDVAIVAADDSHDIKYDVIDTTMERIGGRQWDEVLIDYVTNELRVQGIRTDFRKKGNEGLLEVVRRAVIDGKHKLSRIPKTSIQILLDGKTYRVEISREKFDDITKSLRDDAIAAATRLVSRNSETQIDYIILVGGASNMPQIAEGIRAAFPKIDEKSVLIYEPEKAISFGAAIFANALSLPHALVNDIATHSYGCGYFEETAEPDEQERVENLIKKDSRFPVKGSTILQYRKNNLTEFSVPLFETEDYNGANYAQKDATQIGSVEIYELHSVAKGGLVYLTMSIDAQGIMRAKILDKKTMKTGEAAINLFGH
ncbi:MAG: Hsp70 family protein, partial [Christensenellaceae bacterium]|jgi:molecular chaperone DnaK|nr:Hsp70 family protein [Christensenellaceae bacterium]